MKRNSMKEVQVINDHTKAPTANLVDELIQRAGVKMYFVPPHETATKTYEGPVMIFEIFH